MRRAVAAFCGAILLSACGGGAPNPYPDAARAQFQATCPSTSKLCVCTWDEITRAMTYEEYQAAMTRYNTRGLMDPKVTHARTICLERGLS
jgi:hypothetical protein